MAAVQQHTVDNTDSGLPHIRELRAVTSRDCSRDWTPDRLSQHFEALGQFLSNRRAYDRVLWPVPEPHQTSRRPLRAPMIHDSEDMVFMPISHYEILCCPLRGSVLGEIDTHSEFEEDDIWEMMSETGA